MLLIFAEKYEDITREALRDLFNEETDVASRINKFREVFDGLMEKENEKTGKKDNSFIRLRFISLLLASSGVIFLIMSSQESGYFYNPLNLTKWWQMLKNSETM